MRITTETTKSRLVGAKEIDMKRVFSLGVLAVATLTYPLSALADNEGERHGKRMAKVMAKLDQDESGTISFSEFQLPEGRRSPEMRMDLNGDGVLSRQEVSETAKQHSQEALALFDEADIDGNGEVTPGERRQAAFKRIDQDADGELTENEMRNARKAMARERGRHKGMHKGKRMERQERRGGERMAPNDDQS